MKFGEGGKLTSYVSPVILNVKSKLYFLFSAMIVHIDIGNILLNFSFGSTYFHKQI